MRVSLNVIKQYTDIDLSIDELVAKINAQLGGVEEVINLGVRYEKATIARVVKCEKHPNADKLSVCEIDAGTGENVQVVCGAPNVREGLFVVWLPPGSTVPSSFGDAEPFVLGARELRGVVSNGMLASARELGIGDDHSGIVEITEGDFSPNSTFQLPTSGQSFAEAFGLDDTIIEIENKMFTHRPDLFGQLGVAREIAGIQHKKFTSPEWYLTSAEFNEATGLELEVFNDAPNVVPRFMAVAVKDITVKPSPLWLQIELVRLGGKPINNIVDITNYIMLLTTQPVHAYDYDKLRGNTLGARRARNGESVKLLNDKTYKLDEEDVVIVDGEDVVGLAGVMGGGESEVSSETTNIVLEVANFDMYAVRRTSMRHGLFTDAVTRFNKGQSPLQNDRVLQLLLGAVIDIAGGEQATDVFDKKDDNLQVKSLDARVEIHGESMFEWGHVSGPVIIDSADFINSRLGTQLEIDEIAQLLRNVEISAHIGEHPDYPDQIEILAPFWRTDLEIKEDIVEEVGRLYGYDRLPRELPQRTTKPAVKNAYRELAQRVREALSRAGANEVLTYSFVHEKVLTSAGQDAAHAYQLANALSPDLQFYRLSLTPSLLDKVHGNIKSGHDTFALFELGTSHSKQDEPDEDDLPRETQRLAYTYASKLASETTSPYYQAKAALEFLAAQLGVQFIYRPLASAGNDESAPFEPKRSAEVVDVASGQTVGVIGEYRAMVRRSFKLPEQSAGFELLIDTLQAVWRSSPRTYTPLSIYPTMSRDVCFQVASNVSYQQIVELASDGDASDTSITVAPVDIYQGEDQTSKNVTVRITLAPQSKTLSSSEANDITNSLIGRVKHGVDATVI